MGTKKKELVGDFKNGGRQRRPKGDSQKVRVHDFEIPEPGIVAAYGVYDPTQNAGGNVGTDHDTAAFAVESIRRWWITMGREAYPEANRLLIAADRGGGSNGARVRLWKIQLQKLANETGLAISVCHLPPGTSKWNTIEHRLFSCISPNWRGKPLVSHQVIVNLISSTTTRTGLSVKCRIDTDKHPKGIKVSDDGLRRINIIRDDFHGEWNCAILPSKS